MRSYMTLFALYEFNPNLFDGLTVPEGVDKQMLIDTILMECADLEVLYPNPQTMQGLVTIWAKKCFEVWEKLYKTTSFDYDPIANYDRTFTVTEDTQHKENEARDLTTSGTDSKTGKNTTTVDGTLSTEGTVVTDGTVTSAEKTNDNTTDEHTSDTTGKTVNSGEDVSTVKKAAFNNTDPATIPIDTQTTDKAGTTAETTGKITATDTHGQIATRDNTDTTKKTDTTKMKDTTARKDVIDTTESGTNTVTDTGTIDRDEHIMFSRSERGYGNIGVTTTQQMIEAEREVDKFNIYDYITDEFKGRFCLLIY